MQHALGKMECVGSLHDVFVINSYPHGVSVCQTSRFSHLCRMKSKETATPALVGPSNEKVAATGHYGQC